MAAAVMLSRNADGLAGGTVSYLSFLQNLF
jgi:hypothetical protein